VTESELSTSRSPPTASHSDSVNELSASEGIAKD
jgi:hypothetical protein